MYLTSCILRSPLRHAADAPCARGGKRRRTGEGGFPPPLVKIREVFFFPRASRRCLFYLPLSSLTRKTSLVTLCQGPLHSPAPARTLSTVRRCTLEVVHDVVIIVLSIALLSTESASLYPFGPSNLASRRGRCDAETDETSLWWAAEPPHARPLR